jgi:hypothetical protein
MPLNLGFIDSIMNLKKYWTRVERIACLKNATQSDLYWYSFRFNDVSPFDSPSLISIK